MALVGTEEFDGWTSEGVSLVMPSKEPARFEALDGLDWAGQEI